jgi:hypothetical protein
MSQRKSRSPHFGPLGGIPLGGISDKVDLPGFYLLRIVVFVVAICVISYYVASYASEQTWYRDWLVTRPATLTKLILFGLLWGTYLNLILAAWTFLCILAPLSPHPIRNRLLHFFAMAIAIWTTSGVWLPALFIVSADLPKLTLFGIEWTEEIRSTLLFIIIVITYRLTNRIAKAFERSPENDAPEARMNP